MGFNNNQSHKKMLKALATIILLGVIKCQSEDDYYDYDDGENSGCECSDESVMDKNSGKDIGNCQTKLNGKLWCYVSTDSVCVDKKPSARRPDLFFSYKACNGKIEDDADNDIFAGGDDDDNDEPVVKADDSNCECSDILLHDSKSDKNIGNCQTEDNGQFWCFISSTSQCEDKTPWPKSHGLFFSFKACGKSPDPGK